MNMYDVGLDWHHEYSVGCNGLITANLLKTAYILGLTITVCT